MTVCFNFLLSPLKQNEHSFCAWKHHFLSHNFSSLLSTRYPLASWHSLEMSQSLAKMSLLLGLISTDLEWLLGKYWAPSQEDKVLFGAGREELPQDQLWALQPLNFVLLLRATETGLFTQCFADFAVSWISLWCTNRGGCCSDKSCRWEVRECEEQDSPGQQSKDGELCGRNILATSTAKRQTQESRTL